MKFLLFASALAVLSSASARDDRRRTSTGTIHFSEQVDGALKLIQKGTNSKVDRSPIQQLIYKEDGGGGGGGGKESGGGGGGKDDDDDNNDRKGGGNKDDDDDNDRKGGGNKDSSSSNDRKGGGSSSSSNDNRKGGSSSSSSSSGDTRAVDDICNLGHNACDKGNKKGSDELAFKIECDIVCSSTLCSHDEREHMGCPHTLSSTAKFVQKGAEFKNAASPIQQLIYKTEEDEEDGGGGDPKDDKDDEDRKAGGDNKESSSSNDRKGGPSSSSSSNDRKGGPSSSSSSGDNGPSNDDFCDFNDCGADNLTPDEQALCEVACLTCDTKPPGCPTSGDGERAWKKNLRRRN
jgi:hypothetical protein